MNIQINKLKEGINAKSHRKEDKFYQSYILVYFDPNYDSVHSKFSQPLQVRFYFAGQTCYCCVWGSINGVYFNGSGKTGGYSDDKKSACFSEALQSAGFDVNGLAGTGQNEDAIKIIAEQLMGLDKEFYTIVSAHG